MPPEPGFFEKINALTAALVQHDQSPSVLGKIGHLLRDLDVRREFFQTLQNPDWIGPLLREGYFNDPPGVKQEGAAVQYVAWPESRYLARMAPNAPSHVAAIFATMQTDNPSVTGDMVKASLAMPAQVAASLAPNVCRAARLGTLWIYFKDASELCVRLAEGGESGAALMLAEAMFTPTFEKGLEQPSRRDLHWYKEGLTHVVPALAERKPGKFLPRLCDWLKASVDAKREVDRDADYSYLWRPAIEEHEQNKDYDFAGVMVGFVRAGFEAAVRSECLSLDEALQIVERYGYLIFKRIRLHLITEFAEQNADLARQTMLDRDLFDDYEYKHEYAMLVGRRLDLLSPDQRDQWFGWIDAGPDMSDFNETVKCLGANAPTREDWTDDWKLGKLHWVRAHISGARRDFYERMLSRFGEPELADLNVRVSLGSVGEESPMTADQLAGETFEQAVAMVSSWHPQGSALTGPSVGGLASTFEKYVATKPEEFSAKAQVLVGRPAVFVRGFISRMSEAIGAGRNIDVPAVLELCDWVVGRPIGERSTVRQIHEELVDEDWQWTREQICRFTENTCRARSGDVPKYRLEALRHGLWSLIGRLCGDRSESYIVRDVEKEDPRVYDYLDLAINSPRGKAVEAALEYARWVAEHLKQTEGKEEIVPGGFGAMPEVCEMLDWQIACQNRSIAAMAVIGSRIGLIRWIDQEWLAANADRLFSLEEVEHTPTGAHGWAAWNAYLVWVRPHIDFYRLFKSQFSYAVKQAAGVELTEPSRKQPMDRLGEHLMVLYGRGQLGLDDDDGLLRRFLETSNPDIRRHAIGFVGESLGADKAVAAEIIERFQKLWDVYWAGPGTKDAEKAPNALLFGTWFSCGKFPELWALDCLEKFVEVNPIVEPDRAVGEKLAEIAHADVVKSVRILDKVVRADREGWRIHGWLDSAKRILELAAKTPGQGREQALALIDFLGRRGYTEFGKLLAR